MAVSGVGVVGVFVGWNVGEFVGFEVGFSLGNRYHDKKV